METVNISDLRATWKKNQAIKKADEKDELLLCDISIWEISMLVKRKRIDVEETAANLVKLIPGSRNYAVVNIPPEIAELAVNLNNKNIWRPGS